MTVPSSRTLQTSVVAQDHVIVVSVALAGSRTARNLKLSPNFLNVRLAGSICKPFTCVITSTLQESPIAPSVDLAYTQTLPSFFALTIPVFDTSILSLLLYQITLLSSGFSGVNIAFNCLCSPFSNCKEWISKVIAVNGRLSFTATLQIACSPPSLLFAITLHSP